MITKTFVKLTAEFLTPETSGIIDGQEVTTPIVRKFSQSGTFTISGSNGEISNNLTVKVLPKYVFPSTNAQNQNSEVGGISENNSENFITEAQSEVGGISENNSENFITSEGFIALRTGTERSISLSTLNLPANCLVETDARVRSQRTANGLKFVIDTNKPRYVTIRDPETKMVLGNIRLEGFYFYGVGKTSLVGQKIDALGTTKVTLKTVVSPVLPNVKFKLNIFLAGVTLEDGTTSRFIESSDFNEVQTCTTKFIRTSASPKTAVCHHTEMYQDDVHFGQAH